MYKTEMLLFVYLNEVSIEKKKKRFIEKRQPLSHGAAAAFTRPTKV